MGRHGGGRHLLGSGANGRRRGRRNSSAIERSRANERSVEFRRRRNHPVNEQQLLQRLLHMRIGRRITSLNRAGLVRAAALGVGLLVALLTQGAHGQVTCPCSIWTLATTPGPLSNDASAVELGLKF